MAIDSDELNKRFNFHPATDPKVGAAHEYIRGVLRHAASEIVAETVPSREQSLAITALEEAMMWANAGIARNGLPQAEPSETPDP